MSNLFPNGVPTFEDLTKAYDTLDFLAGLTEAEEWARQATRIAEGKLPLVIVTGGLGAGKTTLMRHLLMSTHDLSITAIVNDVANLNIDAALISEATDDTLALENGCVCCSLSGSVARTLVEIGNRRTTPDLILLEASGVADPWGLAQVTASVPGVSLDCVVTVQDAGAVEPAEYLLRRQVAAADLVLLNKVDLVSHEAAEHTAKRLEELAPRAQVLRTTNCAIPYGVVFDARRTPNTATAMFDNAASEDSNYCTATLRPKGPINRRILEDCLETLPAGILRLKGFLELQGTEEKSQLLQMVGRRWRWEPATLDRNREFGLVVIGLAEAIGTGSMQSHFVEAELDWQIDH